MLHKLALTAAAAVALLGVSNEAHAAPGWHLSQENGYINGACDPGANLGMVAQVGYYGETTPRTGDNPHSAVVVKVTAACAKVTAIPDFRLPPHLARDTTQNIECVRVYANGYRENLVTNTKGACSNSPLSNPWNNPNVFGWAELEAGQSLEVYMPVEYIAVATNTAFTAQVRHSIATNDPLNPIVQFNIGYAARFKNYTATNRGQGFGSYWGSWDGERYDITFALFNYFQGGSLVIEYGTTPSLGSNLGTTQVPNGGGGHFYPSVTASFTGLAQNTTYYWRPKYTTPFGTFFGEMQSFMTYAYLQGPGPINRPCRLGRC